MVVTRVRMEALPACNVQSDGRTQMERRIAKYVWQDDGSICQARPHALNVLVGPSVPLQGSQQVNVLPVRLGFTLR